MTDEHTLYVTGVPKESSEDQVKAIFAQYGAVKSLKVLPARADKPDTAAIISMENPDQAKWLIDNVSGKIPQGWTTPVEIKRKAPSMSQGMAAFGFGKGFGKGPWGWDAGYGMGKGFDMGKGYGKGFDKGWGGKGWGKSWGNEGLSAFPAERKVWIGNVPEESTFQELQAHFGGQEKARFATVMKGKGAGTAGIAFATPEDATAAIEKYNGSEFKGAKLEVDVWTKKEKTEEPAKTED